MTGLGRFALALLVACLLAPAGARSDEAAGAEEGLAEPGGDELVFAQPKDFIPAAQHRDDKVYEITYVREGETAADWTEAIRVQIFFGLTRDKPELSPADFTENLVRYWQTACEAARASPISRWDDHGYPAAVRFIVCARQRGEKLGSASMFKAIKGQASMFLLDRTWRGPAFDPGTSPVSQETMDQWAEFLERSFLCNRSDSTRPCPHAP